MAGQKTGDETLIFMYDNNGDAFGFIYNGEEYYYIKNVQNDIVAIADKKGDIVANYYYDAWGNATQITGTVALNGMGDGALSGAVTGAITSAAGSAVKVSQAAKAWNSSTFKSGYQSMIYHYNKHVVSEGLTKGNNVLEYTRDAVSFANRNSSALKYTYNYKYGNASWNFTYLTGQGGMFTSTGKILTFWYR